MSLQTTTTVKRSLEAPSSKENDQSPGTVRRTWAKVRRPRCITPQGILGVHADGPESPSEDIAHNTTTEYAGAATGAIVKEVVAFLKRDEGDAALRRAFEAQAEVLADMAKRLLLSEEVRRAARMAGKEMAMGISDGAETRLSAGWNNLPKSVTLYFLPFCAVYVCFFMVGLLLFLWRSALFGL